jgi:hypothetical protein
MNGDVYPTFEECKIKFFRKDSHVADLRKRDVENAVAGCRNLFEIDPKSGAFQCVLDETCLPTRESATSRAEHERPPGHYDFRCSSPEAVV